MKFVKELMILACTLVMGAALGYAALSETAHLRVERLSAQRLQGNVEVVAYHDTESKIEILCFYNTQDDNREFHMNTAYAASMSCVPTGRKW